MSDDIFERFKNCAVEVLSVDADKVTTEAASPTTSTPTASTWSSWSWRSRRSSTSASTRPSSRASRPSRRRSTWCSAQALMSDRPIAVRRRVAVTGLGVVVRVRHRHGRLLGRPARRAARGPAPRPRLRSGARTSPTPRRPGGPTASRSSRWPPRPRRWTQSGLTRPATRSGSGVIVGTGIGGLHTIEEQTIVRYEKGPRRVSPFLDADDDGATPPPPRSRCATGSRARARTSSPPARPAPTRSANAARLIASRPLRPRSSPAAPRPP